MRDLRRARARSLRRASQIEDLPRRLRGALRIVALLAESDGGPRELDVLVRELSALFRRGPEHAGARADAIARVETLTARILYTTTAGAHRCRP